MRAAARELGLARDDVRRSVQIDRLSDEAKQAARETGCDHNKTVLLEAAKAPAEKQAEVIRDYRPKAPKPAPVGRNGQSAPRPRPTDSACNLTSPPKLGAVIEGRRVTSLPTAAPAGNTL